MGYISKSMVDLYVKITWWYRVQTISFGILSQLDFSRDMQMKGELSEKVLRDIDMEEDIC